MNDLFAIPARLARVVRRDRQVHRAGASATSSNLRVFKYFGETLRQAGILIVSSTLVIWGLVFIIGLQCGIEGAYFDRSDRHARVRGRVRGLVRPARARAARASAT